MEKEKNPSMTLQLLIEKKVFVSDETTGETRRYYDFSCVIDGTVVRLYINKDDRKLVNYVLDKNAEKFKI